MFWKERNVTATSVQMSCQHTKMFVLHIITKQSIKLNPLLRALILEIRVCLPHAAKLLFMTPLQVVPGIFRWSLFWIAYLVLEYPCVMLTYSLANHGAISEISIKAYRDFRNEVWNLPRLRKARDVWSRISSMFACEPEEKRKQASVSANCSWLLRNLMLLRKCALDSTVCGAELYFLRLYEKAVGMHVATKWSRAW